MEFFFCITEIGAHKLRLLAPFTMDIIKGRLLFDAFSDVFMSCICFANTVIICGNKHIVIVIVIVIDIYTPGTNTVSPGERHGVRNMQIDCLLNGLFKLWNIENFKAPHDWLHCEGNLLVVDGFPDNRSIMRRAFQYHNVIMNKQQKPACHLVAHLVIPIELK